MTTTLRLPPRIARLPQLRQIVRGGLAARGSISAGLAAKAGGAAGGNGLHNSLIAYWPLNEASGDALDLHTNGFTLTSSASDPTAEAGKVYTTARRYTDVSSQYHTRPGDDALLSAGDNDFTVAAWIRPSTLVSSSGRGFIGKYSGTQLEYCLRFNGWNSRFWFSLSTNGSAENAGLTADSFGLPVVNTWYLVVGWHDSVANTLNIQINGSAVDSVVHTLGVFDGTAPFQIGKVSTQHWNGRVGPAMLWKSAAGAGGVLTADQRSALYAGGAGLAYAAFTT